MAGIYIHIPFCKQACHYCNFHFSTSLQLKNDLITALLKEIEITEIFSEAGAIETLYLGGGTPSLLLLNELEKIKEAIDRKFGTPAFKEITLEANPDDINPENLANWKKAGINRLSIGVQSFFDGDLEWMNRAHNARQAIDCIRMAQRSGFQNLSIDLIYGTPGMSDENWAKNLETAMSLEIPHLSCYALTVEPKTALQVMIAKKKRSDIDAGQQSRQFLQMTHELQEKGYEHYEISNFAKPGWRSRHNSSYWQGQHYYGFGPSAHSYDGSSRSWNIANNALYINSLLKGIVPAEREILSATQMLNEYIMTSLRTMEGLDLKIVEKKFGTGMAHEIFKALGKYENGRIQRSGNNWILTEKGKLFADGIAADLFVL